MNDVIMDKEISDWLSTLIKVEPFKSSKDISLILPNENCDSIKCIKNTEIWNDKNIHFFESCWVVEPKVICKETEITKTLFDTVCGKGIIF